MAVLLFGAEVTAAMNHLSVSRSDDPERDKQIVDLVIGGKRVDDVSKMMALHCRRRELGLGPRGSGVFDGAKPGSSDFR